MADGIPGYRGSTVTTSAGKSFMSTVLARMPFSVAIIDNISQLNPKYSTFQDLSQSRDTRINQQSVFRTDTETELGMGSVMIDKNYSQFMYANLDLDKVKRIADYRKMAGYNVMADCLDEIADELLIENESGEYCKLTLKGEYSKAIEEEVQKEWKRFIDIFEFKEKGWERFRQFIIDGELFFENVISEEHPEYGIIGVVEIPTQLINPFYKNVQNDVLDGFALRKPSVNKRTEKMEKEELIIFQKNQVTYIHSGAWNEDRTIRLPYIENARRAYKQLSLIEDSIIIYRLVRAPERLVFHVDVGNMSPPKAESYIKRLMQQYWAKKTYDTTTGRITNVYDPQSMLDSYFFPRRAGTEGTKVEQLAGGANLGTLDDLLYFQRLLYKNMKVPTSRINPEDGYKDGKESSREEIRFGKYLRRIQTRFAHGLKESFITHLKLRKIWDNYKIKERNIDINFNISSSFEAFRQQQFFDLKYNNFNNMCANESISPSFAQKKYLGLTDEEMALNREWKRRDAAFQYELEMLLSQGPAWKQQYQATQAAAAEMGAGGGATMGTGGGAPSTPPDFGPAPETGATTTTPAGGEQTPAGGTQAPAGGTQAPAGGTPQTPAGGTQTK